MREQERVAIRVRIDGQVQGVWFRGWTVEQAIRRHLAGWVRNRRDGSVETLFSGEAAMVQEMIEACRRGPPSATVTSVLTEAAEAPDQPGFHQWPTV